MTKKETKTTKFYQKATFPWLIIGFTAVAMFGFITGWHSQASYQQSLDQEYRNGVASVEVVKPQEQK